MSIHNITNSAKWKQNGITIYITDGLNLNGIYVDDDQTIYIPEEWNHRVLKWKYNANSSQVVVGGNGAENRDIIISKIACYGLAMDNERFLYVVNSEKDEVRRWKIGSGYGTIVAGGNGKGNQNRQLDVPTYIFVDQDHSVYVSDDFNHRVMKWMSGAKEGIVVAGGHGGGDSLKQLFNPAGIIVDPWGNVYVADRYNYRIMCWLKDATEGTIVVGGNRRGDKPNQFGSIGDISFDRYGNLYVVDEGNKRIQQFLIDSY
jgi:sugar lactone lactonase YvrE